MKKFETPDRALLSSAFMFEGMTRPEQIGPELLTDATVVAANMPLYMKRRPEDAPRLAFLLLGYFDPWTPQHADLDRFLAGSVSAATIRPLAKAAIESLYTGPKRPDRGMHEAAEFLALNLEALRAVSAPTADLAADALIMHSDDRPRRKHQAVVEKQYEILAAARRDIVDASELAELTIVSAGSKQTQSVPDILAYQARQLPVLAEVSPSAMRDIPLLALYYARRGSRGQHWSEDQLLPQMQSAAKTSMPEAVEIAWHLRQAGDHDRAPARAATRLLSSFNAGITSPNSDVAELLGSNETRCEERVHDVRKHRRNRLRQDQAETMPSLLSGAQEMQSLLTMSRTQKFTLN